MQSSTVPCSLGTSLHNLTYIYINSNWQLLMFLLNKKCCRVLTIQKEGDCLMNFCDSWSNSKHLGKLCEDFLHFVAATKAEHRCRQNWTQWMKMLSFFCSQKEYLSNESLIQLVSPPMRLSDLWEFHYTTLGYGHLDLYTNTLSI